MELSTFPIHYVMLDILCIHHNADSVLMWLHISFPLKLGFGEPEMYLGAKLCRTRLHNGVWGMGNESHQVCPRGSKKKDL